MTARAFAHWKAREGMPRWEFWAKRRDPIGREIDVTVIAYGVTAAEARAKVDALGVHYDVAAFEDMPPVCPGCHAVGADPCAPGCIDAEIAAEREADALAECDMFSGDDE